MSNRFQNKSRAVIIAVTPLALLAGALVHPYLGGIPDAAALAQAVSANPTRWGIAHIIIGVGIALALLLFFFIRVHLHDKGEDVWSFWATPLATIGLALVAFMVGAEGVGGRGAAALGDVQTFFEAMEAWAVPLYLTANVLLGLGLLGFAKGISSSGMLAKKAAGIVWAGAMIATLSLFLPTGWAAHLVSVGMLAFAWPLAQRLWSESQVGAPPSAT